MRTDDHWLELHIGLRDHPKTARLRRRLGVSLPQAIGHVVLTWTWAVRYAPNGDLSRYDADVIADAAGWEDDAGQFVRALISAGFLDDDLCIHDWDAYAGRLLDRREANARRMREARERSRGDVNGREPDDARAAHATGTRASHVQGLPDLTGPDRTGPDSTPTPQPPPATEREGERHTERNQRRRGRSGGEPTTSPAEVTVPADLAPATDADRALWDTARAALTDGWLPANAAKIAAVVPLGRDHDGALWLRSPPAAGSVAARQQVAAALVGAGDDAGASVVIVEG